MNPRVRAWVEVDLDALVRNARALYEHAGKPLVPMVKADGYGLGAVAVTRALESVNPLAYGVANGPEGGELREAGITRPVIVMTPSVPQEFAEFMEYRLTPTLATPESIAAWKENGGGNWHLAVETGINRSGVNWDQIRDLDETLEKFTPEGVFTHFHSADLDDGSMEEQERRFEHALGQLKLRPRLIHAENSAAICRRPQSKWDCVRPGAFIYGVGSDRGVGPHAEGLVPESVVSLRARVLEIRDVAPGETVGYDATWRCEGSSPRRIATIACGYADGYRRPVSGKSGIALLRGVEIPVIGLVAMDLTNVDVTGLDCNVGDVVTLLGRDGDAQLSVDRVSDLTGLSTYEILTGLRLRLPRFYTGGAA